MPKRLQICGADHIFKNFMIFFYVTFSKESEEVIFLLHQSLSLEAFSRTDKP